MRNSGRWVNGMRIVGLIIGSLMLNGWEWGSASAETQISSIDLQGLSQSWDRKLSNTSRFTVLTDFGGAAVRDNETGLVW